RRRALGRHGRRSPSPRDRALLVRRPPPSSSDRPSVSLRQSSRQSPCFSAHDPFRITVPSFLDRALNHLLGAHILTLDAGHNYGLFHGIAAERLAKLLIEDYLDESRDTLLLRFAGLAKRLRQFGLCFHYNAFEAAGLGHLRVAEMWVELSANEIIVEPKDRIAFFRAPLIVAEYDHGYARLIFAANRAHLVHGNPERAIAGKADAGRIRVADLCTDDRREAIAAGAKQPRRQVFPASIEGRISVADRAVVSDVAGDDGIFREPCLNRAPGLPRRHAVGVALASVHIPSGARIIIFMIHAGENLKPARFCCVDQRLAFIAAGVASRRRKLRQNAPGDEFSITTDANGDGLGQADPVSVDIDLDNLGGLRRVIDGIARKS